MQKRAPSPNSRASTLTRGLVALTKSALLILGVPIAAIRLWQFSSAQRYSLHIGLIIDLVLGLVGIFWLFAVFELLAEVRRAIRAPGPTERSSWSSSWATGIVGLLLLAGGMSLQGSPQRHATAVVRPVHDGASRPVRSGSLHATDAVAHWVAIGLGALIGTALLGRTRQLARLRLSLRAPGGAPETPTDEVQGLVRELAGGADDRLIDWVEALNRLLGRLYLIERLPDAPEIALVRVGPEEIEILLSRPDATAPPPFRASEAGFWWRIEQGTTLERLKGLARDAPRYLPALIPVGSDGAGEILVAVNQRQILGIAGEDELVDATLDAIVTAIRVLPWCDELAVEMVGIEPPPLDEQSVHMQRSNLETLLMLRDRPALAREEMSGHWQREPFAIINRNALSGQARDALVRAAHRFGAIVAGSDGEITLTVAKGRADLAPFGITLSSHLLHSQETALVDRLLQTYARPMRVVSLSTPRQDGAQPTDVEVAILNGPVAVIGAQRQPHPEDVPRVHELLVFLLLHGRQASIARIGEEIFADHDEQTLRRRVENLVATTRATLGRSQSGSEHLFFNSHGLLELDRSVVLDWFGLEATIMRARDIEGSDAMELLDRSLRAIEPARLLGEVARYPWFQAMRYGEYIRATLVDACHHLVALAQDSDQSGVLRAALTLGHEIDPGSEIIARDLMVVADQLGDRTAVETVFRNLQMALEDLGGAEPSALTSRLFHSLVAMPSSPDP